MGETQPPDHPVRRQNPGGQNRKGNRWLRGTLGDAAMAAGKTDTYLGERYRRIRRRRGKKKAIVATARAILEIAYLLICKGRGCATWAPALGPARPPAADPQQDPRARGPHPGMKIIGRCYSLTAHRHAHRPCNQE